MMKNDIGLFLQDFPWEWMGTLTFAAEPKFMTAKHSFMFWYRLLYREEKLRVAACVLFSRNKGRKAVLPKGRSHLHVLLFGKNRTGKTLLDCSTKIWEVNWKRYGFARIKTVTDAKGVSLFLASHCENSYNEIEFFNSGLLKQGRRSSNA